MKKYPEALAQIQKGIELSGGRGANGLASLAHAQGLAGHRAEAQKILVELKDRSKTQFGVVLPIRADLSGPRPE